MCDAHIIERHEGSSRSLNMHLLRRGSGPSVLFIHGIPTNHRLWNGIIQQMQASFSCFAVDLPGLGQSPSEPYGPDYLPRDGRTH